MNDLMVIEAQNAVQIFTGGGMSAMQRIRAHVMGVKL